MTLQQQEYPLPEFHLTRGLITLVNDNHMDNYLKDILAFVYHGYIANSRPNESTKMVLGNKKKSRNDNRSVRFIETFHMTAI